MFQCQNCTPDRGTREKMPPLGSHFARRRSLWPWLACGPQGGIFSLVPRSGVQFCPKTAGNYTFLFYRALPSWKLTAFKHRLTRISSATTMTAPQAAAKQTSVAPAEAEGPSRTLTTTMTKSSRRTSFGAGPSARRSSYARCSCPGRWRRCRPRSSGASARSPCSPRWRRPRPTPAAATPSSTPWSTTRTRRASWPTAARSGSAAATRPLPRPSCRRTSDRGTRTGRTPRLWTSSSGTRETASRMVTSKST